MMAEPVMPPDGEGGAVGSATPRPPPLEPDPRLVAAWKEWLTALATDADAAIAAAHVYRDLDPRARDAWLDALTEDSPALRVPVVAVYAPLLAVESDPARRARIVLAIEKDAATAPRPRRARALRGLARDGSRVLALVTPLYLKFVDVLYCRYHVDEGFVWVRHDALLRDEDAPSAGASVDGVTLEATPLTPVIEDLAHAVLAQRRSGRELPSSLYAFAHLFNAHVDDESVDLPPASR
jgi:hypothetical protein